MSTGCKHLQRVYQVVELQSKHPDATRAPVVSKQLQHDTAYVARQHLLVDRLPVWLGLVTHVH